MLKLPLKYYDDSGRILPPKWLYTLLMLFSLDWVGFIFSLASRAQTETLLSFFYPQRESLMLGLVGSLPVVIALLLISQRERLWKRSWINWCKSILPLIMFGAVTSLIIQVYHVTAIHWRFETITAVKIMLSVLCIYCVGRSRHLGWMIDDWKKPDY